MFGLAVFVMVLASPGQFLTDVDPEEPQASDSLHHSPIDDDGDESFSRSLPVVHSELLCCANSGMEVVVLDDELGG